VRGTDIDIAVAQHAGLGNRSGRVGVQIVLKLRAHLHHHFHRRGVAAGHHAHVHHIADRDALKRNRRAVLDACGIFKIRPEYQLAREQAAGRPRHENDQPHQYADGDQNQDSHPQLRPLNFFAAWHGTLRGSDELLSALRIPDRALREPFAAAP